MALATLQTSSAYKMTRLLFQPLSRRRRASRTLSDTGLKTLTDGEISRRSLSFWQRTNPPNQQSRHLCQQPTTPSVSECTHPLETLALLWPTTTLRLIRDHPTHHLPKSPLTTPQAWWCSTLWLTRLTVSWLVKSTAWGLDRWTQWATQTTAI